MKLRSLKSVLLVSLFVFVASSSFAQVDTYSTEADARKDVATAIAKAKIEGKNIIIMFGGNWSPWCILFRETCLGDTELAKLLSENYKRICIGARENKDMLIEYGNPGRFGYPVFVILNSEGKPIHTQDSALLEEGDGYSKKEIMVFLKKWTVANTK